ncbi:Uncharacterized protein APZ42_016647 [Daphnia magna]|uniref:Uncharacterized protein n=1 Tax=Daphnia magna TaxID=35525 RepID=A0A165AB81_9CRUS|nr:Uncharacterized protein APZ42_016647 [Daphnia magna]
MKNDKNYGKDVHSSKLSTNKSRLMRLLFLAHQLERDFNADLLIYGYFLNEDVGSCGCWSFGETTRKLIDKADTKNYKKYWEKVCSQIEAIIDRRMRHVKQKYATLQLSSI